MNTIVCCELNCLVAESFVWLASCVIPGNLFLILIYWRLKFLEDTTLEREYPWTQVVSCVLWNIGGTLTIEFWLDGGLFKLLGYLLCLLLPADLILSMLLHRRLRLQDYHMHWFGPPKDTTGVATFTQRFKHVGSSTNYTQSFRKPLAELLGVGPERIGVHSTRDGGTAVEFGILADTDQPAVAVMSALKEKVAVSDGGLAIGFETSGGSKLIKLEDGDQPHVTNTFVLVMLKVILYMAVWVAFHFGIAADDDDRSYRTVGYVTVVLLVGSFGFIGGCLR